MIYCWVILLRNNTRTLVVCGIAQNSTLAELEELRVVIIPEGGAAGLCGGMDAVIGHIVNVACLFALLFFFVPDDERKWWCNDVACKGFRRGRGAHFPPPPPYGPRSFIPISEAIQHVAQLFSYSQGDRKRSAFGFTERSDRTPRRGGGKSQEQHPIEPIAKREGTRR